MTTEKFQLKKKDGTPIQPRKTEGLTLHLLRDCILLEHKIKWGPLCRTMKRKPKGRENVHSFCATCGNYVELVTE